MKAKSMGMLGGWPLRLYGTVIILGKCSVIKLKSLINETPNIMLIIVTLLIAWHGARFVIGYFDDLSESEKIDALGNRLQEEIRSKQTLIKQQEQFSAQERAANYAGQLEFTDHIKNLYGMSPETDAIISAPMPKEFTDEVRRFDEETKW